MSLGKKRCQQPFRSIQKKNGSWHLSSPDALFGAIQISKLNNNEMIVLRDNEGKLALEVAKLP